MNSVVTTMFPWVLVVASGCTWRCGADLFAAWAGAAGKETTVCIKASANDCRNCCFASLLSTNASQEPSDFLCRYAVVMPFSLYVRPQFSPTDYSDIVQHHGWAVAGYSHWSPTDDPLFRQDQLTAVTGWLFTELGAPFLKLDAYFLTTLAELRAVYRFLVTHHITRVLLLHLECLPHVLWQSLHQFQNSCWPPMAIEWIACSCILLPPIPFVTVRLLERRGEALPTWPTTASSSRLSLRQLARMLYVRNIPIRVWLRYARKPMCAADELFQWEWLLSLQAIRPEDLQQQPLIRRRRRGKN